MRLWIAFRKILRKDMRTYYLKPPNVSRGLIFPLAWTGMFFIKSGSGTESIPALLPGVSAVSILFGTTSMLAVTVTFEKKNRSFERLLLAPIPLELLIESLQTEIQALIGVYAKSQRSGHLNFEFIDDEGRVNEVDALVLSPQGLFLVEIKSRPGVLTGDAHTWTWTWTESGRVFTDDNPLLLANRKAKRLASLIRRQPALAKAQV